MKQINKLIFVVGFLILIGKYGYAEGLEKNTSSESEKITKFGL